MNIKNLTVERGIEASEMIRIIEDAKQQECTRSESGNKDILTSTYGQCGLEEDSKHFFTCQGEKMMKAKNE